MYHSTIAQNLFPNIMCWNNEVMAMTIGNPWYNCIVCLIDIDAFPTSISDICTSH